MPDYDVVEQPFFFAHVGLVPRMIYYKPEEETSKKPGAYPVDNTIYKTITFNEKVVMVCVLLGIFVYCMKKKFLHNWKLGISKFDNFEKWKKKKIVMEEIIESKHPADPWG